jgi:DHA1 family bicyclomycin/chloramphenicol resistance-like MFS transporter
MTAPATARLHPAEFVALLAMQFATIAFSIDAMLPALPEIAAELSPADPNRAQLIITSFVLGMGLGTFVVGPLSDAFGRKRVILAGSALYCAGALWAWSGDSLTAVLAGRVVQGIGAAGPRVVSMALVRDLYQGRQMARITSIAMMIFTLVPAVAPLLGALIIGFGDWRRIFGAFVAFSLLAALWMGLRQPETLPPAARRPLRPAALAAAAREVAAHPVVRRSMLAQAMVFAALFSTISAIQPVFDQSFGRADSFPLWFALIALCSAGASLLNAALVVRLGMRRMVSLALYAQIVASVVMAVATVSGLLTPVGGFALFLVWAIGVFFMVGLTLGNLNAIALEPMGHIAGTAASLVLAAATVASVVIALPVALAFDGTPAPLAGGVALLAAAALMLTRRLPGL